MTTTITTRTPAPFTPIIDAIVIATTIITTVGAFTSYEDIVITTAAVIVGMGAIGWWPAAGSPFMYAPETAITTTMTATGWLYCMIIGTVIIAGIDGMAGIGCWRDVQMLRPCMCALEIATTISMTARA